MHLHAHIQAKARVPYLAKFVNNWATVTIVQWFLNNHCLYETGLENPDSAVSKRRDKNEAKRKEAKRKRKEKGQDGEDSRATKRKRAAKASGQYSHQEYSCRLTCPCMSSVASTDKEDTVPEQVLPGKYIRCLGDLSDAYLLLDSAKTTSQRNKPPRTPPRSPTPTPTSPPSSPPFRFASVQPRGHITRTAAPSAEDDSESDAPDALNGLTEEQLEHVLGGYREDASYFVGDNGSDEDGE